MTNTVLLLTIISLVLLGILTLVTLFMVTRFGAIRRELNEYKQETTRSVNESIGNFGNILAGSQKQSADMQDKRLSELAEKFNHLSIENEQKLESIRTTMYNRIGELTEDNNKQLEKMRETVDEKLQKTLEERIGQSFRTVNDSLNKVSEGLGEMQSLASGVGDLKKVLSNVKTRGILGEVQLGAILEEILPKEQYEENVNTKGEGGERVEFAVKLPGRTEGEPVYLPIDSKFPGETYASLVDAYEEGDTQHIQQAQKNLINAIKSEAKDIRTKYIMPPRTTNFGIMFLPFEGLYAEVVRLGMVETLQRDFGINIAGPTTMAAMLNSLQMGFRTLAIQKRSNEVWEILGAVKTEFGRFEDELVKARNNMEKVSVNLDNLVGTRTRMMRSKLKKVEELPGEESASLLGFDEEDY